MKRDGGGARCVEDLIEVQKSGVRLKFVFFWSHRGGRAGELSAAVFSQWWPVQFSAAGKAFGSAEQYMMWRKADLFGDRVRADAILQARSAAQAKDLGRTVRGFDEAVWERHRVEIVVTGSVLKFGSDPALCAYLVGTGSRVLAEASPRGRIWGIGLAKDSEFAERPECWPGLNLLGFALMEARARVASGGRLLSRAQHK